ncbi:MAG: hypothetical protein JW894_01800 [Bacteroidales bacterium]|nr:hypothetical protein [Bacteroidales bacterium]
MKKVLIFNLLLLQCFISFGQQEFTSPDGKKKVKIEKITGDRYRVSVNSTPHRSYQNIVNQKIYFFTDSNRVAYIAKCHDGKFCVVTDGVEQPHYKEITGNSIIISPDRNHYAYMALTDRGLTTTEICYVIDGKEQPRYDNLSASGIVFSPDSKHWAYGATNNDKWFYVIDGVKGPDYDAILNYDFSPDSKHWVYGASVNDKWFYTFDGIKQPVYDGIMQIGITFSPDSRHWAYGAKNNDKWFYIIDGVKEPEYDGLISTGIVYSPDSKRWAYAVLEEDEWFYVIDGEEQPHYKQITAEGIVFSSDGNHWAYGAEVDDEWVCVLDGKEPPHQGSNLCSSYNLPYSSPSIEISYLDIGFVRYNSMSGSDFEGDDNFNYTEDNGVVILPKLEDQYGFNIAYGVQSVSRKFSTGGEFSYTHLFPKATWSDIDVKIKYYYFIDFNLKFSYLPIKSLSLDLLLGLNLMTRMKIEDGSFTYNDNGDITDMGDVKLKGGIFKGFPYNALCGLGISCKVAPKLVISANANARYIVFKRASGVMGKNKELTSSLFEGGLLAWAHNPSNNFQIAVRFLLD